MSFPPQSSCPIFFVLQLWDRWEDAILSRTGFSNLVKQTSWFHSERVKAKKMKRGRIYCVFCCIHWTFLQFSSQSSVRKARRIKTCAHVHGAFMKHRNERGGLTCGQQGGASVRPARPQTWRLHRDAVLKGSIKDGDEDRILWWHFKSAVPVWKAAMLVLFKKKKKQAFFWSQLETSPHVCLSVTRLGVIGVTMGTVGSNQLTDAIGPFRLVCIVR